MAADSGPGHAQSTGMNQLLGALKSCAYIALLISTCVFFSRFQESVNSETPEGVVVTAKTPPTPAAASSPAIKTTR